MPTRRTIAISLAALSVGLLAIAAAEFRPDEALRAATALEARTLCGDTFLSGFDPDQTAKELFANWPFIGQLQPLMRRTVDETNRAVTVSLSGLAERRAAYHDGYGCDLDFPGIAPRAAAAPGVAAIIADPWHLADHPTEPTDPRLLLALDEAFAERPGAPQKATKAIVVVANGRIIAERYAPGIGADTPLRGWSVSKSVTNALIGVLVRQGKLRLDGPAPVAAWASPTDPRHAVTLEELLRMTSGVDFDETNSGFDANARMQFISPDMASFAESQRLIAPPGTRWAYSSPGYLVLSQIIRNAVGGHAEDVRAFAERELFTPIGMQHATMAFDTAGTPIGSTEFYASARDWARFGLLYLNDGMVGGVRILPEGWATFSASATEGAEYGYGAGFWTNLGSSKYATLRVHGGMPADSYLANGILGQRVIIAPAEHFVIVRLGRSQDWPSFDMKGMMRLTAEVNTVVNGPPP